MSLFTPLQNRKRGLKQLSAARHSTARKSNSSSAGDVTATSESQSPCSKLTVVTSTPSLSLNSSYETCLASPVNQSPRTNYASYDDQALQEELNAVNDQLTQAQIKRAKNLKYIQSLHNYNEIKDIAQALLGHLASMDSNGATTKSLYPVYGLELTD
jgi:hypothetical protein